MDKIKILYTIPNFDTAGSGKALLKIANRLNKNYFNVEIACLHNKGVLFEEIKKSGIKAHIFNFTVPMIPRLNGFKECWRISKRLKSLEPDLIHSFHYAPDYSEPLSAKIAGIPWTYTKKNMNWGGGSKNGWKLRTFLAKGIIVQNTDMINSFFSKSHNVELIPRGVDTEEFRPRPQDLELLKELGLSSKVKIILVVANLVPVKGIEILIQAFKNISQSSTILLIVGDDNGEYGNYLKRLVEELGLSAHIIFTGKRHDVSKFYSIADLFILPTLDEGRKEGSPVAVLEAMASGVPVIGTDIPGIRDQLSEIPEQMVQPRDSEKLAEKMLYLLKDQDLNKLKNRQLEIIRDNYLIETEVKRHERVYELVLGVRKQVEY